MASTPPIVKSVEEAAGIYQLLPGRVLFLIFNRLFYMCRPQRLLERLALQVRDFLARGRWAAPLWRLHAMAAIGFGS